MEKSLKSLFKPYKNTNLVYLNYKGIPIYFDRQEFKNSITEEDIIAYIKAKTEQKPKPKPKEDILPFDQGLEEFQKGKDKLTFLKFYNSRK
jgi:hypothetical protein